MGYMEELLATNEEIVYRTKQHWIAPIFGTVSGVILLVAGVILFGFHLTMATDGFMGFLRTLAFWGSIVLVVVGAIWVGYSYIRWWVDDYAVTNQKVVKVSGLLNKRTSGSALEKINDVIMEQGPLGRALGYGTLKVATASDTSELTYQTMRAPADFRRAMLDQKVAFEQADSRHIADAVRAAAPRPPSRRTEEGRPPPQRRRRRSSSRQRTSSGAWRRCATTASSLLEDYEAKKTDLLAGL